MRILWIIQEILILVIAFLHILLYNSVMDNRTYPDPKVYRPWLGVACNIALIRLAQKKNEDALVSLSTSDYLEKMIAHWWKNEFPGEPFPGSPKDYFKDLDFVQST